jgi:RND family efflux transporter MFP subunit
MRKAQLDRVEGELAKSKVAAPAAGIVILEQDGEGRGMQSRDLQPGDRVWEGRPVATIADLSEMQIEIQLDPDQARRVKRKQKVIITVDAITGKTFEGEVAEISQTATENTLPGTGMPSGERTFPAKIAVKNLKGTVLLPGMTAQVRIITKTIKDTVSVPKECVFDQNDVKVVYVKKGDAFSAVEVETGDQSDGMIIITRGLKGRETLSLRAVKEGNSSGSATTPEKKPPTTAPATGGVK